MNWSKVIVRGWMIIGNKLFVDVLNGVKIFIFKTQIEAQFNDDKIIVDLENPEIDYLQFIPNSQFDGAERIRLPQETTLEPEEESPRNCYGYGEADQQGERPGQEALFEDHQNGIQ